MVVYMAPGSAYLLAHPPITFILLFGLSLTLTISSSAAFTCLLREVGYYPAMGIWSPYDFLAGYPGTSLPRWSLVFGIFATKQRFRCVLSAPPSVFGNKLRLVVLITCSFAAFEGGLPSFASLAWYFWRSLPLLVAHYNRKKGHSLQSNSSECPRVLLKNLILSMLLW